MIDRIEGDQHEHGDHGRRGEVRDRAEHLVVQRHGQHVIGAADRGRDAVVGERQEERLDERHGQRADQGAQDGVQERGPRLSPMMWETMMNFLSTNWKLLLISRKQVGSV